MFSAVAETLLSHIDGSDHQSLPFEFFFNFFFSFLGISWWRSNFIAREISIRERESSRRFHSHCPPPENNIKTKTADLIFSSRFIFLFL